MAITNLVNEAANTYPLFRGSIKSWLRFSTDAVAGIATTISATAAAGTGTLASGTGWSTGDCMTIANADVAGTGPWVAVTTGITGTAVSTNAPLVRSTVSGQACTRWERFLLNFRPKKVTLRNLSNNDEYTWRIGRPTREVIRTVAAGTKTTLTGNTLWLSGNALYIHPDILPVSSNFEVELDY